jgi:hypothetical protein
VSTEIDDLLIRLIGAQIVRVAVGPAGVHYQYARAKVGDAWLVEFEFFANTLTTIHKMDKGLLFQTGPFPPFSCQTELQKLLLGRKAGRGEFDQSRNTVRVEHDNELLLSFVPRAADGDVNLWLSVFPEGDISRKTCDGFIVSSSAVRRIAPETHRKQSLNDDHQSAAR